MRPTVDVGRVLAMLLLVGAGLAVPLEAVARDVCPTVSPASVLPDPSVAVEIDSGEPLARIEERLARLAGTIDHRSQVTRIRRIPDPLPVDASDAWVRQFGYALDRQFPGDQIEQISPRYEAILCIGTRVPKVIGLSVVQARDALNARGLVLESGSDGVGSVADVRPAPDALVEFGTAVELVVANELVEVPALIGRPFEKAVAVAGEVGLAVDPSPFEGEGTGLWGTVRNQQPGAGDLAGAGTSIEADVDVLVEVPNVVGDTVSDAEEVLTEAGLRLATFTDPSDRVVDQSPDAGQRTVWGSSVELKIDAQRPRPDRPVPELTDMTLEQARAAIAQADLRLNVLLDSAPPGAVPGTVLRQDPEPGTEVEAGSPVDAVFEPLVPVPDLRNRTRDQATEALDQVQLSLQAPDGTGGSEVVTGQDPPAGQLVPLGSPVTVQLTSLVVPTDGPGIPPWAWVAAGAVVLAAGSAAVNARSARSRRARRWVQEHVAAEGHPGPSSQDVHLEPRAAPSLSVRLVPHAGTTTEGLTEGGTDEHRQPGPGR